MITSRSPQLVNVTGSLLFNELYIVLSQRVVCIGLYGTEPVQNVAPVSYWWPRIKTSQTWLRSKTGEVNIFFLLKVSYRKIFVRDFQVSCVLVYDFCQKYLLSFLFAVTVKYPYFYEVNFCHFFV